MRKSCFSTLLQFHVKFLPLWSSSPISFTYSIIHRKLNSLKKKASE